MMMSVTGMPARSSARRPLALSAIDSSSGSRTHSNAVRAGVARLPGDQRDEAVCRLGPAAPCELAADDAMFLLEVVQDLSNRGDGLRRREQTQRVTGRRGIDDDFVVRGNAPASPREICDFDHADQFVDARHRQIEHGIHVMAVEPGAVLDRIAERLPVIGEPPGESARRVEFDGPQGVAPGADDGGPGGEADAQGVAERMGGIG